MANFVLYVFTIIKIFWRKKGITSKSVASQYSAIIVGNFVTEIIYNKEETKR